MQLHPDDKKAFEKILAHYVKTWNARDLDAWSDIFSDNVDYINRGGGWWTTNKDNVEGHRALFEKNPNAPKTYKASIEKISILRPDIALVHVRWVWPGIAGQDSEKDFNGIMSWVLIKEKSTWLVRSVQNTVCV